jgi:replicative DNA helicase
LNNLPPPSDLEAEAAVLSACFLKPEDFDQVAEILEPRDFYSDANRLIWQAALDMALAGDPIDSVTLAGTLRDGGKLDKCGGTPYLVQLLNETPAVAHVLAHARRVKELARLRRAIALSQRFVAESYQCEDVQEHLDRHEQELFNLSLTARSGEVEHIGDVNRSAMDSIVEASKRGGAVTGTSTGFRDLDEKTAGMHAGDLILLAARPGVGKTACALNIAVNVANSDIDQQALAVAVFSMEMPKEQLSTRMMGAEARVNGHAIRSGQVNDEDWTRLTEASSDLGKRPIWIDDTPGLNLVQLRSKVRRIATLARRGVKGEPTELGLIVIDYLQLMRSLNPKASVEEQLGEISRSLKELAKELGVPILALSQLNRSVETRGTKDKRPLLSDLRSSGSLEQDADVVIFLYRDDYYFKDSQDRGVAELIIAKQRSGPTGTVRLKYTAEYTRFDNLADDDHDFSEYDDYQGDDIHERVAP